MKTPTHIPWQGNLTRAQALPITAAQINEPQTGKVTIEEIRRQKNGERFGKSRTIQRKRRG